MKNWYKFSLHAKYMNIFSYMRRIGTNSLTCEELVSILSHDKNWYELLTHEKSLNELSAPTLYQQF